MNYFPQLSTGATVQYPFETTRRFRTVMNLTEDGGVIRFEDLGLQIAEWRCRYDDLSMTEWEALKSLHAEVEGRLDTFTFFDPSDNLLVWSDEFDRAAWVRDPFIGVASGAADPLGGSTASLLSSGSSAEQRMTQVVRIPGTYSTCFSIWLRGNSGNGVSMVRLSGGGLELQPVSAGAQWKRFEMTGRSIGSGLETEFGLHLAGGANVEAFGAQVEVQPAPSGYKRTTSRSGIYTNARFLDDRLDCTAVGPGRFQVTVGIQAAMGA